MRMDPQTESLKLEAKPLKTPAFTIVVPFHNECGNLEEFYQRLKHVVERIGRPYELVFVDDGSDDGTFTIMERLKAEDPLLRVVKFRWNFGQTAALAAGCEVARGEIIITMDGDLQHNPADIPRFLAKMQEGWQKVS